MDFDFITYVPDWDGDWCGTGPKIPLPDPQPDPWPAAMENADVLDTLEEAGLWPFPDKVAEVEGFFEAFAAELEAAIVDLEEEDRLGNHEIQRLMQIMNQNDTLEANVRKKTDDTANAIIGKI